MSEFDPTKQMTIRCKKRACPHHNPVNYRCVLSQSIHTNRLLLNEDGTCVKGLIE